MKKIVPILITLLILSGLGIGGWQMFKPKQEIVEQGSSFRTITPKNIVPTSKSPDLDKILSLPIIKTGVKEEEQDLEKRNMLDLLAKLQNEVPMVNINYLMDFDYKQNKFVVKLKTPYNKSEVEFWKWWAKSEYRVIPETYFKLMVE